MWAQLQKESAESFRTAKEKWGPELESFGQKAKEVLTQANAKAEELARKTRDELGKWKERNL